MIFLWIALKDVLLLLKDKKALLTLLITPLVLTLVLGLALSSLWSAEMPPSQVLYKNDDQGEWGLFLFEEVFTLPALEERFVLEETNDLEAAKDQVRRGRVTAMIHIPAGFSQSIAEGGQAKVSVWGDPGSTIRVQYLRAVVERFAVELSSRRVIFQILGDLALPVGQLHDQVDRLLEAMEVEAVYEDGFDRTAAQSTAPAAMDYYAAGMGVMYLLFTANAVASKFVQERHDKTLARMLQSPASRRQIIFGKFIGIFLTGMLQFTLVILASTLFFGVSWGHPLGVALLAAGTVCGATGIGLLIASFAKTASAADAAGTFVILSMSALGGSMFPIFAMPPLMQTLTKITLNSWAMEGFMKLMFQGGGPGSVILQAGVLAAAGFVLSLIAARRLSGEVG